MSALLNWNRPPATSFRLMVSTPPPQALQPSMSKASPLPCESRKSPPLNVSYLKIPSTVSVTGVPYAPGPNVITSA